MSSITEAKVLVIYTGGTIGMLSLAGRGEAAQGGLAPEPFFLTESLRSQSRFHDPFEDSLFSHSSSVEGFRRWNTSQSASGRSSPQAATFGDSQVPAGQFTHKSTVRSSRPIIHPLYPSSSPAALAQSKTSVDHTRSPCGVYYETQLPTLVTPRTHGPSGFMRRIRYAILEACSEFSAGI
jgi:lysophospholipase